MRPDPLTEYEAQEIEIVQDSEWLYEPIENQEWYTALIEECHAIITEAVFNSRWALVEGYHMLGKRILEENNSFERGKIYGKEITKRVSQSLGKSVRTVEKAIQFARSYPSLDALPGGKNVSWNKVCNELLPEGATMPALAKKTEGEFLTCDRLWFSDKDLRLFISTRFDGYGNAVVRFEIQHDGEKINFEKYDAAVERYNHILLKESK